MFYQEPSEKMFKAHSFTWSLASQLKIPPWSSEFRSKKNIKSQMVFPQTTGAAVAKREITATWLTYLDPRASAGARKHSVQEHHRAAEASSWR